MLEDEALEARVWLDGLDRINNCTINPAAKPGMAHSNGSSAKLLDRLIRPDLLIVDDWATAPPTEAE